MRTAEIRTPGLGHGGLPPRALAIRQPGTRSIIEDFTYTRPGRYRATIRAEGGFGPGCGTVRRRYATARTTIVIR